MAGWGCNDIRAVCSLIVTVGVVGAEVGALALPVALALDDEFERGGLQPVERGLGEQWVGHHGQHLRRFPVRGDDGGGLPVAFHDEFVEVAGLLGAERVQGQVVELPRHRGNSTYPEHRVIPTVVGRAAKKPC